MKLGNYVLGKWTEGDGEGKPLYNAVNGDIIGYATTDGIDLENVLAYGRSKGDALRKMTFQERGNMLKKLALYLTRRKEEFYPVSYKTGATRADGWIDIEGGFGNLFANASLRRNFPNQPFHVDGDAIDLSRGGSFMGHHIMVPKRGVAIHINAFNFPVWGMLEKTAVNWMAGVPAVVKPATATSFLTEAVVRAIIESEILPEGTLQLICGSARTILDGVDSQDVVTFTGSASTGRYLKANENIINNSVPFNMEADSLNCSVLGPDAVPGTPEFDLFVKEVRKEMTTKCGQKCTAIRRIMVPENLVEAVNKALNNQLARVVIGDPENENVRMGALASKDQVEEVREQVGKISVTADVLYGDLDKVDVTGADAEKGAFLSPVLMLEKEPFKNIAVHEIEAFGPVSTMMPYKTIEEAVELARMGKGSLCCSIATGDDNIAREFVVGAASHHGRILVINEESAKQSTGHGSPLPYLVHGGPGRAGGGEEMGGMRGVKHYLQRCAIQGSPSDIANVTGIYQSRAKTTTPEKHPFRYHFEDLKMGMSITTDKRLITREDIQAFADLTGDHFYAHTQEDALQGSIFEKITAHGYFILAAAAGLFVHPDKGPVLANYGLDNCRFLQPLYYGDSMYVKFTCREKRERDWKGSEFPSGVVEWLAEVYDDEDELSATATVLTLVKKKDPFTWVTRDYLKSKLDELTENHKAKWGIMTPQHMVEHLETTLLWAIGEPECKVITPEERLEKYRESLWNYRPMPREFQLPLLRKERTEDLRHSSLAEAKGNLLDTFDRYEAYYYANPDDKHNNPISGPLDKWHWDLLNRKHAAHHFEQFGLA